MWRTALACGIFIACSRQPATRRVDRDSAVARAAVRSENTLDAALDAHTMPDAAVSEDVAVDQPADASVASAAATIGHERHSERGLCSVLGHNAPLGGRFIGQRDLTTSFVDGDDLLALVNRSPLGTLPPDYAPSDLVELRTMLPITARECDARYRRCLRTEAADALRLLMREMDVRGFPGEVESAYRGYRVQCDVFHNWARIPGSGFCKAAEESALAGHSQHQLGTTVDLFSEEWKRGGPVFRAGFGCDRAGRWLASDSWTFGFVVSYPLHPDDRASGASCAPRIDRRVPLNPRTGYRNEPWHLRYVGVNNAARYHADWVASGPGTPNEITLEQWLRRRARVPGDADLPVCDGCSCQACATLSNGSERALPCGDDALQLDGSGRPVSPIAPPRLVDARVARSALQPGAVLVEVRLQVPAHTVTQTPTTNAEGPLYASDASYQSLVPYTQTLPHRYPDLPGAWRIAVEPMPVPSEPERWPWRASLGHSSVGNTWNRANVFLPSLSGSNWFRIPIVPPPGATSVRVTLLRDGVENDTRDLPLSGLASQPRAHR